MQTSLAKTKPAALEAARAQLAGFLATPLIAPIERAWHPSQLTDHQQAERRRFEEAMRAGELRRGPTVFGDLDVVPA
ncbi:MAG: hypothetical protein ABI605_11005 [Rhizobacter sp.]